MKKLTYEEFKKDLLFASKGFGILLFYHLSQYLATAPLLLLNIDINNLSYLFKVIYVILYQVIIVFVIFLVFKKKILNDFKIFKEKKREYLKNYFKYWFLMLIFVFIANLILFIITSGGISGNEETIRSMFKENPYYVYISAVLIAPFTEEFVFRLGVRNIFKTDKLFIIMSGILFGFVHVLGNFNTLTDLLYVIPYSIPGFVFGYIYTKSNNIFVSTFMHMFHNGVLISLQVIFLLIGVSI